MLDNVVVMRDVVVTQTVDIGIDSGLFWVVGSAIVALGLGVVRYYYMVCCCGKCL